MATMSLNDLDPDTVDPEVAALIRESTTAKPARSA